MKGEGHKDEIRAIQEGEANTFILPPCGLHPRFYAYLD